MAAVVHARKRDAASVVRPRAHGCSELFYEYVVPDTWFNYYCIYLV